MGHGQAARSHDQGRAVRGQGIALALIQRRWEGRRGGVLTLMWKSTRALKRTSSLAMAVHAVIMVKVMKKFELPVMALPTADGILCVRTQDTRVAHPR